MFSNGIDIVFIPRMKKIISKKHTLEKLFTPNEIRYLKKLNYRFESIAGIFAAKEALIKALHLNLNEMDFLDCEVSHKDNGEPYFIFYNDLKEKAKSFKISLSISHDNDYAIAMVLSFQL